MKADESADCAVFSEARDCAIRASSDFMVKYTFKITRIAALVSFNGYR